MKSTHGGLHSAGVAAPLIWCVKRHNSGRYRICGLSSSLSSALARAGRAQSIVIPGGCDPTGVGSYTDSGMWEPRLARQLGFIRSLRGPENQVAARR
jgi:hypothetical protein